MSAGLKWMTLARPKVFNEQCDPAMLAIRFEKHRKWLGAGGRCSCYASICPSDTKQEPHALKWLLLDPKTDSVGRPCLTSSTCPLWSAVLESWLEQMADDPPAHLLTFSLCRRLPSGTFACISIKLTCVIFELYQTWLIRSFLPTNVCGYLRIWKSYIRKVWRKITTTKIKL